MKILVWIVKNLRNKIKKKLQLFSCFADTVKEDIAYVMRHLQKFTIRNIRKEIWNPPPRSLLTNVSTMSSCRKMCLAASTASLSLLDQVSASLWARIWDCVVQVAHQLTSPPVLRIINTRGSRGTSRPKKNLMHTAVFIASECLFFYIS